MLSPAKRSLVERVLDAVRLSGAIALLEESSHPAPILAIQGSTRIRLLVYIWRLTPGGPEGVRPEGEYRIQITGARPPLQSAPDATTLLLGYEELTGVFAGFNTQRRTWGSSPSVQIRWEAIEAAQADGFGFYLRETGTEGEVAVAFTAENFLNYVERHSELHDLADSPNDLTAIEEASKGRVVSMDHVAAHGRRRALRTIIERLGQSNFSTRIKTAYRKRCAACGIQLNLVEAAHIVPVAQDGSNDTSNGICLCHLHHRAYDSALLGIMPDFRTQVSQRRVDILAQQQIADGIVRFRENLLEEILSPLRPEDRPLPRNLELGLQVRGFM